MVNENDLVLDEKCSNIADISYISHINASVKYVLDNAAMQNWLPAN